VRAYWRKSSHQLEQACPLVALPPAALRDQARAQNDAIAKRLIGQAGQLKLKAKERDAVRDVLQHARDEDIHPDLLAHYIQAKTDAPLLKIPVGAIKKSLSPQWCYLAATGVSDPEKLYRVKLDYRWSCKAVSDEVSAIGLSHYIALALTRLQNTGCGKRRQLSSRGHVPRGRRELAGQ
jgi:hypothetical protein